MPKKIASAPDFSNTEIAFSHLSNLQIYQAYALFAIIGQPLVVSLGPSLTDFALKFRLPIKTLIKKTIFSHFCGGENLTACTRRINELAHYNIGTILDFAREGGGEESEFNAVADEIKRTIDIASQKPTIPFTVFKPTGIGSIELLTKIERGETLNIREIEAWTRFQLRFKGICQHAARNKVRIMIDAEESWIQNTIDHLALEQMTQLNQDEAYVFNTVQLYRHDRNEYLKNILIEAQKKSFFIGVKLVRGAYLEKETRTALAEGRPSPLNPNKISTDAAYDQALQFCIDNISKFRIIAGTHNEASTLLLTKLMKLAKITPNDHRIFFAQLLGMSDNLSYNLASSGFNVAKYVPYGTIAELLPYLTRRAQENSSVAGQSSRELTLLAQEIKRRKNC